MRKFKSFLLMDRKLKLLLFESYFYLGWARILKNVPFSKVAPSLGIQMQETTRNNDLANKQLLSSVSQAIHMMSRYTFWESQCLVKAIAAMKMLEKRNVESTLYLGTAKDESGKLVAHAWLRSGSYYITGSEVMEQFTVVSKFAKNV
ncbi:lasso peptide biosynthesis B2 protein [Aquibacillus halophilus]|uniref:Lasso peptide biosynthesis B2 protein n=1 Tax=Aquibacillus halophilus TaxID=930132 RepID=A0A6A8DAH6_9BACI|nr:lasso peptide biosynthesis B2 protein [Aquibacillus halophilus]MRH42715.1 lasso peptide biosynthesis B2 protein [Aquibacillus halophilus]